MFGPLFPCRSFNSFIVSFNELGRDMMIALLISLGKCLLLAILILVDLLGDQGILPAARHLHEMLTSTPILFEVI